MTDSRLPGKWLTDLTFEALSDRAWRTFCGSLMWSNVQGTDGDLPPAAMKYLHPEGVDDMTRRELVKAGLWTARPGGGVIVPDWESRGQSTAARVAELRENARNRQQKHRAAKKAEPPLVTSDVTRDVTRESLGQEGRTGRTGQEDLRALPAYPVAIPGGGSCRHGTRAGLFCDGCGGAAEVAA